MKVPREICEFQLFLNSPWPEPSSDSSCWCQTRSKVVQHIDGSGKSPDDCFYLCIYFFVCVNFQTISRINIVINISSLDDRVCDLSGNWMQHFFWALDILFSFLSFFPIIVIPSSSLSHLHARKGGRLSPWAGVIPGKVQHLGSTSDLTGNISFFIFINVNA